MGIIRWHLNTKFKEDVEKCNFWRLKGGFISQYEIRIDGGGTIHQIENDTFSQAQFQLGSPVPVELSLALSFIITTPILTHPPSPPTWESRDAA